MNTGERIKRARKNAGLTQKELGDKLSISYQQIGQYENGARNPKKETLQKIADALGVQITDLLDATIFITARKRTNETIKELAQEQEELAFLNKIDELGQKLNNAGQAKAIEQVELLTKIPEYTADEQEALNTYLEFIKDKKPDYWEKFKDVLSKIESTDPE